MFHSATNDTNILRVLNFLLMTYYQCYMYLLNQALLFLCKAVFGSKTFYSNIAPITTGTFHVSELAGQTGIFKNRFPLLVRFVLSNQSIQKYYTFFMVDLWENLVEKVHFTFKTTGPAGQFWQMERALRLILNAFQRGTHQTNACERLSLFLIAIMKEL